MIKRYPGVEFKDLKSVYIEETVKLDSGTVIEANVSIKGDSIIGKDNLIASNTVMENVIIGDDNQIKSSYLVDCRLGDKNIIGPFAHIRGHTEIVNNNHIGNFVELKNVKMGSDNNAMHLSYLGDAVIGKANNFGAGCITANYNTKTKIKSQTQIANYVSIGSNAVLVAPIKIGSRSTVAAGSVITRDVPEGNLAIARERQNNKENYS